MKNSEIRALSIPDLEARINSETSFYERMKFAHDIAPIENPMRLQKARRTIARLKTELTARKKQEQLKEAKA